MRKIWGAIAALVLMGGLTPALANDSTAELAAGGLVLRHTANIEMRSEDLFISPSAVRVTYHFRNTSAAPIATVVAFPMPDITTTGPDDNIAIPNINAANFLNFATTVDGRPVAAQMQLQVISRGVDRTAYLRQLGVPLAPYGQATGRALDRLPAATRAAIIHMGLAMDDEYDDGDGHGMVHHMQPTWTLKTTYYWTQTFPPGRDLVVQHRYAPAVGQSVGSSLGDTNTDNAVWVRQWRHDACIDDAFMAYARTGLDGPLAAEQRIRYVLVTGANWARPIGDFHMVIDKGVADAVVSFCGNGVRRISPTQFEVRYHNFTPRQDVAVVILHHTPRG